RVIDQNTGAVVVQDLPHPHRSSWTVRALQQGYPGATALGGATIPLFSPGDDEFKKAKSLYDLLAIGQKVEAYLGPATSGTPRFSAVITDMSKRLSTNWELTCDDTLIWLQRSQAFYRERVDATTTGL